MTTSPQHMNPASQYANRPRDEKFETLEAMISAAQYDKDHSVERTYNLRDLQATVLVGPQLADELTSRDSIALQSPTGIASFTHYSFGQLARTIGAPASYLRSLPPAIAADCINHGLKDAAPVGTTANLLIKANGGTPVVRACTSETYGRVWDANLYGELNRHFGDGSGSRSGTWMAPPIWPDLKVTDGPGGQYRGDRDSFVIRVDGGSIVTDPSAARGGDSGQMFRGIMVRNSEVGHCSITVECILFRYICGNHNLWGAIMDRQFRRRHVGTKITRDTMRELNDLAWKFNQRSARQDEQIIMSLIEHEIAHTKEAVVDELKKMGATKEQALSAYDTAERKESASPRSFWGIAQGFTRNSQESGWQDDRLALDQLAAQVLKKGAAQYVTV